MIENVNSGERKSTGFRCYRDELFVGDLLSVQSGYGGFVRVVERDGGFWLVDWESEKGDFSRIPAEERIPDTPLDEDIAAPYRKVDPNDPYREPPFPIYCDQCEETVVGFFDVEEEGDRAFSWTEDCASHNIEYYIRRDRFTQMSYPERSVTAICKACAADPARTSPTHELNEHFRKRLERCPVRMAHYPRFHLKEEIDMFFDNLESLGDTLLPEDSDICP